MFLLLKNADVYAPESLGVRDVLVAGDRIVAVSPSLAAPPRDWPGEVVDLCGRTLVPGLVDVHLHLAGGGGEGGAETRVPPVALTALTRAGVTTGVGLLGTDATTRGLPELLACARAIEALGLTAYCCTGAYEIPPPTLTGSVRGDLVHVDRMVAVGEVALSDPRCSQPTFDELARLAADAHVAGMMTGKAGLLHLHMGDGRRALSLVRRVLDETELPCRTFHPTHCNRNPWLWEEALDLGRRGGFVDVTAFPEEPGTMSAAEAALAWVRAGLDPERLTMSSDGGGCLPEFDTDGRLLRMGVGAPSSLLDAVRALVRAGVPLSDALPPLTANPARLYRFARKGRIAAGLDADLVVLGPGLAVDAVLARGRWMVRGGAPCLRGPFEAGPAGLERDAVP